MCFNLSILRLCNTKVFPHQPGSWLTSPLNNDLASSAKKYPRFFNAFCQNKDNHNDDRNIQEFRRFYMWHDKYLRIEWVELTIGGTCGQPEYGVSGCVVTLRCLTFSRAENHWLFTGGTKLGRRHLDRSHWEYGRCRGVNLPGCWEGLPSWLCWLLRGQLREFFLLTEWYMIT